VDKRNTRSSGKLHNKNLSFNFKKKKHGTELQSGGVGVRTPVMTSDLTISAFLPIELGFMEQHENEFKRLNTTFLYFNLFLFLRCKLVPIFLKVTI